MEGDGKKWARVKEEDRGSGVEDGRDCKKGK